MSSMARRRVRIRFRKQGDLRHFGHLDVVRAWERLLRRAGVPLVMGQGCHPRPRISFPSALPLGEAGWDEVLDVELDGDQTIDEIHTALGASAPPGLTATHVEELTPGAPAATLRESVYELPLPADRQAETADRVRLLLAQSTLSVKRDARPAVDLRELLLAAEVDAGTLRFRVRATREQGLRARDVLAALGLDDLRAQGLYPTRTQVLLER
jgi:radical SAM-linked protein